MNILDYIVGFRSRSILKMVISMHYYYAIMSLCIDEKSLLPITIFVIIPTLILNKGKGKYKSVKNTNEDIDPYTIPVIEVKHKIKKVICLDIETTGINKNKNEILQISIIDGDENVLFNEYIKPTNRKRWPDAEAIHGITPKMVADKQTIDYHIEELNNIIKSADIIVGYNSNGYDIPFLQKYGVVFPSRKKYYDVMLKFAPVYGEWNDYRKDYKWQKLITCANYYEYDSFDWHNSLEDAKATLHCYHKMIESNIK